MYIRRDKIKIKNIRNKVKITSISELRDYLVGDIRIINLEINLEEELIPYLVGTKCMNSSRDCNFFLSLFEGGITNFKITNPEIRNNLFSKKTTPSWRVSFQEYSFGYILCLKAKMLTELYFVSVKQLEKRSSAHQFVSEK